MVYTIEGRVISKKNNWMPLRRGNRIMSVPHSRWKKFEREQLPDLKKQKGRRKTLKQNIFVDMTFLMKGKGASDLDNMVTSVLDLLQKAEIIADDKEVIYLTARKIADQPEYMTEIALSEHRSS